MTPLAHLRETSRIRSVWLTYAKDVADQELPPTASSQDTPIRRLERSDSCFLNADTPPSTTNHASPEPPCSGPTTRNAPEPHRAGEGTHSPANDMSQPSGSIATGQIWSADSLPPIRLAALLVAPPSKSESQARRPCSSSTPVKYRKCSGAQKPLDGAGASATCMRRSRSPRCARRGLVRGRSKA